jgi:hypothetical protein
MLRLNKVLQRRKLIAGGAGRHRQGETKIGMAWGGRPLEGGSGGRLGAAAWTYPLQRGTRREHTEDDRERGVDATALTRYH